jgi:hypothetical protein
LKEEQETRKINYEVGAVQYFIYSTQVCGQFWSGKHEFVAVEFVRREIECKVT